MKTFKYLVVALVICGFGSQSYADDGGRRGDSSYSDRDKRPAHESQANDAKRPVKGNAYERRDSRPEARPEARPGTRPEAVFMGGAYERRPHEVVVIHPVPRPLLLVNLVLGNRPSCPAPPVCAPRPAPAYNPCKTTYTVTRTWQDGLNCDAPRGTYADGELLDIYSPSGSYVCSIRVHWNEMDCCWQGTIVAGSQTPRIGDVVRIK